MVWAGPLFARHQEEEDYAEQWIGGLAELGAGVSGTCQRLKEAVNLQ